VRSRPVYERPYLRTVRGIDYSGAIAIDDDHTGNVCAPS
jgi:hypothetical protein